MTGNSNKPTTDNKLFWLILIPILVGVAVNYFTDWYRTAYGPPKPTAPDTRRPVPPPLHPDLPPTVDSQSAKYPLPVGTETRAFISCLAASPYHLTEGADYSVVTISPLVRYLSPLADERTFSGVYENCREHLKQN